MRQTRYSITMALVFAVICNVAMAGQATKRVDRPANSTVPTTGTYWILETNQKDVDAHKKNKAAAEKLFRDTSFAMRDIGSMITRTIQQADIDKMNQRMTAIRNASTALRNVDSLRYCDIYADGALDFWQAIKRPSANAKWQEYVVMAIRVGDSSADCQSDILKAPELEATIATNPNDQPASNDCLTIMKVGGYKPNEPKQWTCPIRVLQ